jgi:hypothetical protein
MKRRGSRGAYAILFNGGEKLKKPPVNLRVGLPLFLYVGFIPIEQNEAFCNQTRVLKASV